MRVRRRWWAYENSGFGGFAGLGFALGDGVFLRHLQEDTGCALGIHGRGQMVQIEGRIRVRPALVLVKQRADGNDFTTLGILQNKEFFLLATGFVIVERIPLVIFCRIPLADAHLIHPCYTTHNEFKNSRNLLLGRLSEEISFCHTHPPCPFAPIISPKGQDFKRKAGLASPASLDNLDFIGPFAYIWVCIPNSRSLDKRSKTQTIVPWECQDEQGK